VFNTCSVFTYSVFTKFPVASTPVCTSVSTFDFYVVCYVVFYVVPVERKLNSKFKLSRFALAWLRPRVTRTRHRGGKMSPCALGLGPALHHAHLVSILYYCLFTVYGDTVYGITITLVNYWLVNYWLVNY
jgi:hypothetical protein